MSPILASATFWLLSVLVLAGIALGCLAVARATWKNDEHRKSFWEK